MKMRINWCSLKLVMVWALLVGLAMGGTIFLTFWGVPRVINGQIQSQTELEKGTEQWTRFKELPFPISFSVRFFEVSNADKVKNDNEKPVLNETGPYTYKMSITKKLITFDNSEEDSVSYERDLSFVFDDSNGLKETDKVTIINPLLMASLQITTGVERLAMAGCLELLYKPDLIPDVFITVEVGKLLFQGLNFAYANSSDLGVACRIVRNKMLPIVKGLRNIEVINEDDEENSYLKFALFNYKTADYQKDNPDGRYTVNRGRDDLTELGNIIRWNSDTRIDTWGSRYSTNNNSCNLVRGTDSTIYRPLLEQGQGLTIFNTDICRSVDLIYKTSDASYNGITAFKYETSPTLFRASTDNAENDCFCTRFTNDIQDKESCYLDGVLDIKPCIGSPILASQPHFLNADQSYRDKFEGLNASEEMHGIYLLLEPNTGTPLAARKRVQLNSVLRRQSLLSFFTPPNMYEAVFPVMWLEESVELPQEFVDLLNTQLFSKVNLAYGIAYGLIGVTAAAFAISVFFLLRKACVNTKTKY